MRERSRTILVRPGIGLAAVGVGVAVWLVSGEPGTGSAELPPAIGRKLKEAAADLKEAWVLTAGKPGARESVKETDEVSKQVVGLFRATMTKENGEAKVQVDVKGHLSGAATCKK
jgi:hypothetical protein